MLEDLGLDDDETAVLMALLGRKRPATGSELRDVATDPEASLDLLSERGLVARVDGGTRFRPTDPLLWMRSAVWAAEERTERLRKLSADLHRVYRTARADELPADVVEYLPGDEATIVQIYELMAAATQRICALDFGPWSTAAGPQGHDGRGSEFGALARGVEFRVIYERAGVTEAGRLEDLLWSVDRGEQARVLPSVPCLFYLVDDVAAVPVTDSGKFGDGGLLVHGGPLLTALQSWYETLWSQAIPLDVIISGSDDAGFTAEDRALIAMLASGLTDKAIARQLGVSDRTAQRRVAAVTQRLGAQSRFQAGLQASRQGLF